MQTGSGNDRPKPPIMKAVSPPQPAPETGTPVRQPDRCPQCHGVRIQPIVYGYPTKETLAAAQRGELVLGGCSSEPWLPEWNCAACGHQWLEGNDLEKQEWEEMLDFVRQKFPKPNNNG